MGRINIEVPDELHRALRIESAKEDRPQKELVIEALRKEYGEKAYDAVH